MSSPLGVAAPTSDADRRCRRLCAQADADDPAHREVAGILRSERGPIVTSELALAEADHLILDRLGLDVEIAFSPTSSRAHSPSSA